MLAVALTIPQKDCIEATIILGPPVASQFESGVEETLELCVVLRGLLSQLASAACRWGK